jgi:hypothetical protein
MQIFTTVRRKYTKTLKSLKQDFFKYKVIQKTKEILVKSTAKI